MLLQKIAHTAHDYVEYGEPSERAALENSLNLFEASHYELLERSDNEATLKAIYYDGDAPLHDAALDMMSDARSVLASPKTSMAALENLETNASGDLAEQLDTAVSAFESVADSHSMRLTVIQEMSLFGAFLVILGEIALIFRPAHRAILGAYTELEEEHEATTVALSRLSNFSVLAADLFWETDIEGNIIYAEGTFLKRLQGERDNIIGCNYLDVIQMDDENLHRMVDAIGTLNQYENIFGTFSDSEGRTYEMLLSGMPRRDAEGNILGYLGTADDVSDQVAETEAVRTLAYTDALTGLANKRAFEEKLGEATEEARLDDPLYLLALDLDGFKPVNDTHGHGAGDEVLKIVAARMKSMVREGDWCARTGGDEFFVVCTSATCDEDVTQLARRLNGKLSEPYGLSHGLKVSISASIGIASAPMEATDFKGLTHSADVALYKAKDDGRNTFSFYSEVDQKMEAAATEAAEAEPHTMYYI